MNSDPLADVLQAVRLRGAVFYSVTGAFPWAIEAPVATELLPHLMPEAQHLIEYHVVVQGSCWAGPVGERSVKLQAGDVVVFPQGHPHVLSSAPGMRGASHMELHRSARQLPLPITVDLAQGRPCDVQVVCGFLGCDARPFNPLLGSLPCMMHLDGHSGDGGWRTELSRVALEEAAHPREGGQTVLARLSELLFIDAVRSHLRSMRLEQTGWLAGLRDPTVGRALTLLHASPARPWTLEALAKEVGVSRSVLAERFGALVGVPPMQYLARWRMQLASAGLQDGTRKVADIAQEVGYGSEEAFSRAFRKLVGCPPARWRQRLN